MLYNNTRYWTTIHKRHLGQLRAVGHPGLSEGLNQLKYGSEAEAFLRCLELTMPQHQAQKATSFDVLDIGAGTGYWSNLVYDVLQQKELQAEVLALDLSSIALELIQTRTPHIKTVQIDLKAVDVNHFQSAFDLAVSCYCLHHLTNFNDFLNALRFAARSVKGGGHVILMDPILTMPYSKFDVIDFQSYRGNGIPRHLYLIDDLMAREGYKRQLTLPAVSFLFNGNIEGYEPVSYYLLRKLWRLLELLYRSERLVNLSAGMLVHLDRILKQYRLGFSSTVCMYKKLSVQVA